MIKFYKSLLFLFLMILSLDSLAQISVSGKVVDGDGNPLIGATIRIKGTTSGTTADYNGNFSLELEEQSTLLVSFVGYFDKEVIITEATTSLSIVLEEDIQGLEEVIVVGYGSVKKSDLTGSVGSVKVDEIQKIATVDVARSIQGKVAGVQVVTNSGAPGSGTTIRVRGIGSFANADPLYVVDGFLTGDISNISPNDIQSMEVLKDASATAIYGSRGSNGVILITTKSGKGKDGFSIDFNAYGGVQSAANTLDVMNSQQYAEAYLTSVGGNLSDISESDLRSWIVDALAGNVTGTDWQEEVLNNAPIQSYDLSLYGGYKNLNYKFGGSFFDQEGIVNNTFGQRIQANGQLDYKINDKISVSAGIKYSVNDYTNYDQGTYSSVLATSLRKDPINPIIEPTTGFWDRTGLTDISNPVRMMEEQQFKTSQAVRIQPNVSVSYEIIEGLTFKTMATWDDREIDTDNLTPTNTTVESRNLDGNGNPSVNPNETRVNQLYLKDKSTLNVFQWTNTLNYNKVINKHSINALIGLESFEQETSWNRDQIFEDSMNNVDYNERAFSLLSYFARVVYSFDNRYLVTATIRRDGSSKFPESGRWGTFPSFSVGWNLDQEAFFPTSDVWSGLKLRASWGEVGNQAAIQPFRFFSTLSQGWSYAFNNQVGSEGYASTFLPAATITWETSSMTNLALDFYFLDDRLTFTGEYYIKKTEDLLVDANNVPSPVFAGAFAPATNAASMENDGIELTLDFKQKLNDLFINVGGNISFINNQVTSLGAGESITGANYEPKIGMPVTRTVVGGEFAAYYGLQTLGIFQTQEEIDAHGSQPLARPGDVRFLDSNGDNVINADDAVLLGSAIPDFTYGFYINAEYKRFDISASFIGSKGNEIANIFNFYIAGTSAVDNNLLVSRQDYWTGPGSTNTQPRLTNEVTNNDLFSDRYIEDGSFLRLRNIQVGYTLPTSFAEKVKMKSARIYASADNLFTITDYSGYDPEVGLPFNGDPFGSGVDLGNYPLARTIIMGVNFKF